MLLIAHSFGTPNTLPLRPMLTRDAMIALPASLSSVMAQHRSTIPVGPSYAVESARAVDWLVAEQQKAEKPLTAIKVAIVYQRDDYGQDGLTTASARRRDQHGIAIVGEHKVLAGQRDFDEIVERAQAAGATHVLLTRAAERDRRAARGGRALALQADLDRQHAELDRRVLQRRDHPPHCSPTT